MEFVRYAVRLWALMGTALLVAKKNCSKDGIKMTSQKDVDSVEETLKFIEGTERITLDLGALATAYRKSQEKISELENQLAAMSSRCICDCENSAYVQTLSSDAANRKEKNAWNDLLAAAKDRCTHCTVDLCARDNKLENAIMAIEKLNQGEEG